MLNKKTDDNEGQTLLVKLSCIRPICPSIELGHDSNSYTLIQKPKQPKRNFVVKTHFNIIGYDITHKYHISHLFVV